MTPLISTILVAAGAVFFLMLVVALAFRAFFKVPKADEALVKTGGSSPKVSTGGGVWVVPLLHNVARVSLQAIRVPIDRTGADAVPSKDMIPAEIKGEMFVQINPQDSKAIVLAVQSLGTSDPSRMAEVVRLKIDSQVTDALRTAAFQKTFIELNSEKKQFADAVVELMQDDLGKLGLTLTAVSVTHVTQGPFTQDAGDVIAAQGRRNVAETVERNRQETNLITRNAQIAVQKQDVEARERALELELTRKQKEADQARQVDEYEATQKTETAKAVLLQAQAEEEARAAKERAVAEAVAQEAEKTLKAQIAQQEQVAIRRAEAAAAQKSADEAAAIRIAEAEAKRRVAEEAAAQEKLEAEIAKNKAVDTANIAKEKAVEAAKIEKEQAIKVADEERQKAVETAEVERQLAVALKRAEEAAARATQANAEAKQRAAEEQIVTVKETAMADRRKQIVTIQAEEEAAKDRINADKAAYVEAKRAEGERDAAIKRAEAAAAKAKGEADAVRVEAEGYASDKTTRAKAEFEAAENEAQALIKLAEAKLEQGKADAESRRLLVEAENVVAKELLLRDVAVQALQVAPDVVREFMAPVANVAHDVKVLQVNGLGGDQGEGQSVPSTILGTGLALSGGLPLLRQMVESTLGNDDVKAVANELKGVVSSALDTVKDGGATSATPKSGAIVGTAKADKPASATATTTDEADVRI